MSQMTLQVVAPSVGPAEAYRQISDFARYPELSETFREVRVSPLSSDGSQPSDWSIDFRNGLMRWQQRTTLTPERQGIAFEQVVGDFGSFRGGWRIDADGKGSCLRYSAEFDLGVPSLAEILDPVFTDTFRKALLAVLTGLLGEIQETAEDTETAQA